MNESEKKEFMKQLVGISRYFKSPLDEFDANIYWKTLKKYTLDEFKEAMYAYVENPKKGVFMPKVADIVREIKAKYEPPEHRAMLGWSDVERQIRSVGSYDTPNFKDPLITHVIHDMGGWISICAVMEKDLVWMGKDFERRYLSYAEYPPIDLTSRRLTGTFLQHNEKIADRDTVQKLYSCLAANEPVISQKMLTIEHIKKKTT